MVSILQVRTKFLEEENSRLQDRIDSVTQQKHGLDKLLKEQKLGKEREVSMNLSIVLYSGTVKPVLISHSQRRPKLVLKSDYSLMQVKSISEC